MDNIHPVKQTSDIINLAATSDWTLYERGVNRLYTLLQNWEIDHLAQQNMESSTKHKYNLRRRNMEWIGMEWVVGCGWNGMDWIDRLY